MLRNVLQIKNNLNEIKCCSNLTRRSIQISTSSSGKVSSPSSSQQSKVINKLFGGRVTGSKRRWFPTNENESAQHVIFKASQFGKTSGSGSGKNTSRRMVVLNKLFMKHITDLLATGEASQAVLGRGMQVTRVKISKDFSFINVYWLTNGDPIQEQQLEKDLFACGGLIRHELSQLCLMSEVPKIRFVHDKTYANMNLVENALKNMDFTAIENEEENGRNDTESELQPKPFNMVEPIKQEFFGKIIQPNSETTENAGAKSFPVMRHDVLGLDHRDIMSKIATKMRKSKQAWDTHNQNSSLEGASHTQQLKDSVKPLNMEQINERLALNEEKEAKFKEFLAKRREKRNTPDRKKYRASENMLIDDIQKETDDELILSKPLKQLYELEDYYLEDEDYDDEPKKT